MNGSEDYLDMVDINEFCARDLDSIMVKLGYEDGKPIYYNFLRPGYNLDDGLTALENDLDICTLFVQTCEPT